MEIKRGSIYLADLGNKEGSIQFGVRPVIVIGNSFSCKHGSIILCVPLTSKKKKPLPTHYELNNDVYPFLWKAYSLVLSEQIILIEKKQILEYLGDLKKKDIYNIGKRIQLAVGVRRYI